MSNATRRRWFALTSDTLVSVITIIEQSVQRGALRAMFHVFDCCVSDFVSPRSDRNILIGR